MFALRLKCTNDLVGFNTSVNDGDLCVDVQYRLSNVWDKIWVTPKKAVAEKIVKNRETVEWYEAGFDNPINPYIGKLEVVELKIK